MKDPGAFRGCLLGGAVGDALGYGVEFLGEQAIRAAYGPRGITQYRLSGGMARISDDTQMALFTAAGLLAGREGAYLDSIRACYREWLITQEKPGPTGIGPGHSGLMGETGLYSPRAPGMTCLSAIRQGAWGGVDDPINDSKGCGGIMRVAPIALYMGDLDQAVALSAAAAALTHGHELGWLPAAALVHVLWLLLREQGISIQEAVLDMQRAIPKAWPRARHMGEMMDLVDRALALAEGDMSDPEAVRLLGEGWVAEETLAIALYCALRHAGDFEGGIVAGVNHGGDSDSTGAVAGNILGARLGIDAIPDKFQRDLELSELILSLADRLFEAAS